MKMKEELQLSNKHNYSQYSNKKRDAESVATAAKAAKTEKSIAPAEVKMESVEPIKPVAPVLVEETTSGKLPSLVEETVETVSLPETVTGVVAKCTKLNVRVEPNLFADVACVLDAGTEMEIDITQSNNDWFKVYTPIGVEGYCMRKFVNAYL